MATTKDASHSSHVCCIIPPYVLESIMNDESAPQSSRDSARMSLEHSFRIRQDRATLNANVENSDATIHPESHTPNSIIPPYMLEHIANDETNDPLVRSGAESTLQHSATVREARQRLTSATSAGGGSLNRMIYTSRNSPTIPGWLLRSEGQAKSPDESANLVYDHFGETYMFSLIVFGRFSVDDHGLPLIGSIHFNPKPPAGYANALWNGSQMEFGDGDGSIVGDLSKFLDVTAHEITHGVTQYTAALVYEYQSGALNESMSDVFASMVTQHAMGQNVENADWLIGKGIYINLPNMALRSLKAPGTAHSGRLGPDRQVAHFRNWVVLANRPNTPTDDHGGVHINSGIPNHAFYLMCMAMKGFSWDIPGKVWYATLTDSRLKSQASFIDFAELTVDNAKIYGADVQGRLLQAWADVGVYTLTSYSQVWNSTSGIGNFNLNRDNDRIFAFDYLHSGKTDHLVVYRPGTGTIWILQNSAGTFSPVYHQGDPGNGIGNYNLMSDDDQAFAFDYESSGKLDYIALYRPGTGTFWILKNSSGTFSSVYQQGDPGSGIAGYNLNSKQDKAFAFEYNNTGGLDHIALYRPGAGAFWIAERDKKNSTVFRAVYDMGDPGTGIGNYDLGSSNDRAFAYDYNSSGKLDHIVLYRPGTGICWIIKHIDGKTFESVYQSQKVGVDGIGGFNLRSSDDKMFAYDFDGSGKADHLVCYTPGTGTIWILHNYGGTFLPAYRQGSPGLGIGNWDLLDRRDLIVPFDFQSKGFSNHLLLYRPGTGNIRILQRLDPVLNP